MTHRACLRAAARLFLRHRVGSIGDVGGRDSAYWPSHRACICHNKRTMKKLQLAYLIVGVLVVLSMLLALLPPPR